MQKYGKIEPKHLGRLDLLEVKSYGVVVGACRTIKKFGIDALVKLKI